MEKRFAQIISILFHPLFLTFYGLLIFFHSGLYISYLPQSMKKWIYIIVAVNTAIVPLSLTPIYLYRKIIASVQMENSQERIIPLIINAFLFYLTYYLLSRYNTPDILRIYILAGAVCIFIAILISWRWKVSLHMLGIGALTGAVLFVSIRYRVNLNLYLILLILISGIIGFSRLFLNAHNPFQIYLGYLVGFFISGTMLYYL
ncbi:MAG: hypothetical protein QNK30_07395 [Bacteroidales bacterium]|nr:hypothetical protein [Bacteroidales bacterium]